MQMILHRFHIAMSGLTKMAESPGKDTLLTTAILYAISEVEKAEIVEQLQAKLAGLLNYVFLYLPTDFGKSLAICLSFWQG